MKNATSIIGRAVIIVLLVTIAAAVILGVRLVRAQGVIGLRDNRIEALKGEIVDAQSAVAGAEAAYSQLRGELAGIRNSHDAVFSGLEQIGDAIELFGSITGTSEDIIDDSLRLISTIIEILEGMERHGIDQPGGVDGDSNDNAGARAP